MEQISSLSNWPKRSRILFLGGNVEINDTNNEIDYKNLRRGASSSLIQKLIASFCNTLYASNGERAEITYLNGLNIEELKHYASKSYKYDIIFWFVNVPDNVDKIVNQIKFNNPKCLLITSKRNTYLDTGRWKYNFNALVNHALNIKSNLVVEFTKIEDKYNMRIFDPLGNIWYNGLNIQLAGDILFKHTKYLSIIKRKGLKQQKVINNDIYKRFPKLRDLMGSTYLIEKNKKFIEYVHQSAKLFHEFINPVKDVKRFLGNASFRCTKGGFPSFRSKQYKNIIFMSPRNVNKECIETENFIPVFNTIPITDYERTNSVLNYTEKYIDITYIGKQKPSVDTIIQYNLYRIFPKINYMIHSHCYVENPNGTTKQFIPCGGLNEVNEIIDAIATQQLYFNPIEFKHFAINLKGHGSIICVNKVSQFKKYKFIKRPIPEKQYKYWDDRSMDERIKECKQYKNEVL